MAPEVMNSGKVIEPEKGKVSYYGYNHASDWWSLGVIMYTMKFLRKPFVKPESRVTNDPTSDGTESLPSHSNMER